MPPAQQPGTKNLLYLRTNKLLLQREISLARTHQTFLFMLHYRKTFIALLIACISCSVHAQENPKYDKETEDKIKQVENNLSA